MSAGLTSPEVRVLGMRMMTVLSPWLYKAVCLCLCVLLCSSEDTAQIGSGPRL